MKKFAAALAAFFVLAGTVFAAEGPKVITVKGVGSVSARPDFVEISMTLYSLNEKYESAMDEESSNVQKLTEALCAAGFSKTDLKTTNFNVEATYKTVKDKAGNSSKEFAGYRVEQRMKVAFDLDSKRLSAALSSVANCTSNPDLSIRFTVKDPTAVDDALLRSAAENAKRKAEILCESLGAKLGELRTIDYNWGEINVYSRTKYNYGSVRMLAAAPEIEPDDIEASDSATFVWEIK